MSHESKFGVHQFDVSDIFEAYEMTFEQRRDLVVDRIRATAWFRNKSAVQELTTQLANSRNSNEFADPWNMLYLEADDDGVQINIHPSCRRQDERG